MKRISLLLPILFSLVVGCTSAKEDKLMSIGQMIIDSEIKSMQLDDSIRRAYCAEKITPAYVLITEKERHDNIELYVAFITESGEDVDAIAKYRNRIIAICYAEGEKSIQIPSDLCEHLSFDEREWYILFDTKNDKYVAVKSVLNIPPENILQLHQRNWADGIQEALMDTSVPLILQQKQI